MLGIAESFKMSGSVSTLAGVVMRRDLIIDGMMFGHTTIEGDDATRSIISIYQSLARDDISCIMINGLVLSMYNIVDGKMVASETGIPIIAITFEDSDGIEDSIKHHFRNWQNKLDQYQKLGPREKVLLKTGKSLFIRYWDLNQKKAIAIINSFTAKQIIHINVTNVLGS